MTTPISVQYTSWVERALLIRQYATERYRLLYDDYIIPPAPLRTVGDWQKLGVDITLDDDTQLAHRIASVSPEPTGILTFIRQESVSDKTA